jgi:hypothetical protein
MWRLEKLGFISVGCDTRDPTAGLRRYIGDVHWHLQATILLLYSDVSQKLFPRSDTHLVQASQQ